MPSLVFTVFIAFSPSLWPLWAEVFTTCSEANAAKGITATAAAAAAFKISRRFAMSAAGGFRTAIYHFSSDLQKKRISAYPEWRSVRDALGDKAKAPVASLRPRQCANDCRWSNLSIPRCAKTSFLKFEGALEEMRPSVHLPGPRLQHRSARLGDERTRVSSPDRSEFRHLSAQAPCGSRSAPTGRCTRPVRPSAS